VSRPEWPGWWDWELELSPHLLKRMTDRRFTEIDLRRMLNEPPVTVRMLSRAAGSSKRDTAAGRGRVS
jgi:hypothetical protein